MSSPIAATICIVHVQCTCSCLYATEQHVHAKKHMNVSYVVSSVGHTKTIESISKRIETDQLLADDSTIVRWHTAHIYEQRQTTAIASAMACMAVVDRK